MRVVLRKARKRLLCLTCYFPIKRDERYSLFEKEGEWLSVAHYDTKTKCHHWHVDMMRI